MGKLNQVIAVVNGKKSSTAAAISELYHKLQKDGLLAGLARTYQPKFADGDQLPAESKLVQLKVNDAIAQVSAVMSDLFDVIATQEYANCKAHADIVVDGVTIVEDVPVTYLLFLEKQLVDIHTMVAKLPVLDPAFDWDFNNNTNCYSTKPIETTRTKKVPRNHIKYDATEQHPAQVEIWHEDIVVGTYSQTNFSGAIPEKKKSEWLDRVRKLQDAVKMAREEANGIEAQAKTVGKPIFEFLFN